MRALWRRALTPLLIAAAIASAAVQAAAAGPASHNAPLADCPAGTAWNHITLTCQ